MAALLLQGLRMLGLFLSQQLVKVLRLGPGVGVQTNCEMHRCIVMRAFTVFTAYQKCTKRNATRFRKLRLIFSSLHFIGPCNGNLLLIH